MYILKNDVMERGLNDVCKWMGGSERIKKNEVERYAEVRACMCGKDGHWVMKLVVPQKMTVLWIDNGNAGTILLLSKWHFDGPCQLVKCKKHSLIMKFKK